MSEYDDPDLVAYHLLLAKMLMEGNGCEQDIPKARRLLVKLSKCEDVNISTQAKEMLGTVIQGKTEC